MFFICAASSALAICAAYFKLFSSGQRTFERSAFDELHHQVDYTRQSPDIVNLADIGMIQRRNGLRLTLEAFAELSGGDFDRNVALQTRVAGSVHLSHATGADGRQDFVGAEFVTG